MKSLRCLPYAPPTCGQLGVSALVCCACAVMLCLFASCGEASKAPTTTSESGVADARDDAVTQAVASPAPVASAVAGLSVDRSHHDFGTIGDQAVVSTEFVISNTASRAYKVRDTLVQCGCIQSSLSNRVIAPNESVVLTVTFDPRGRQAEDRKTVTVLFEGEGSLGVAVSVRAYVLAAAQLEPRTLSFGERTISAEPLTRTGRLVSREPTFELLGYDVVDPATGAFDDRFKFEMLSTEPTVDHERPAVVHSFQVTFSGKGDVGRIVRHLRLQTNLASPRIVTGNLMVSLIGPLQVLPDAVQLGTRTAGSEFSVPVRVRRRDGGAVRILAVEILDQEGLRAEAGPVAHAPNMPGFLQFDFKGRVDSDARRTPGPVLPRARIVITTDEPEQETLEIPVFLHLDTPGNSGVGK